MSSLSSDVNTESLVAVIIMQILKYLHKKSVQEKTKSNIMAHLKAENASMKWTPLTTVNQ